MPFKAGQKIPGQGRPRGSKGAQVKSKTLTLLAKILKENGEQPLRKLCKDNIAEFMRLMIALLPKEEQHEISGKDGGPIEARMNDSELMEFIKSRVYGLK
jgi:hypothetical protein